MDNHIHLLWQAEEGYTSRENSVKEGLCLFQKGMSFYQHHFIFITTLSMIFYFTFSYICIVLNKIQYGKLVGILVGENTNKGEPFSFLCR